MGGSARTCTGGTNGGLMSEEIRENSEIAFDWQHQRHVGNMGFLV
ncbi:MAG: hypothetical protein V2A76_05555 [Planctomycetota bacterium]